jgi:hypothetical protein
MAVAEDDECKARANMPEEELARRRQAHRRVEAGIHPDDYEDFDNGIMVGYDANGEPVPGPNAPEENFEDTNIWLPEF